MDLTKLRYVLLASFDLGPKNKLLRCALYIITHIRKKVWISQYKLDDNFFPLAEKVTLDPRYESDALWGKILESIFRKINSHKFPASSSVGVDCRSLPKFAVQRIDRDYNRSFRFARFFRKILAPGNASYKVVLIGPRELRDEFSKYDVPIDNVLSGLFYAIHRFESHLHALFVQLRTSFVVIRDYFSDKKGSTPKGGIGTVWIGLAPFEVSGDPSRLDAVAFIESPIAKKISPFNSERWLTIHRDWERQPEMIAEKKIVLSGADLFSEEYSFSDVCNCLCALSRLAIMSGVSFFKNAWWELPLLCELQFVPRARHFFTEQKVDDLIIPNALAQNTPVWTQISHKKFRTWMLFCAHMGAPAASEDHPPYDLSGYDPFMRYCVADRYVVWDKKHKSYLMSLGYSQDAIVALEFPLLFTRYPNEMFQPKAIREEEKVSESRPIEILVFDINPYQPRYTLGYLGIGRLNSRVSNVMKFIEEIISTGESLFGESGYKVVLKIKRPFKKSAHEPDYIEFVEDLKKRPQVRFADPYGNIFDLFQSADCCISFPFGSPGVAASLIGVPCVYYDTTGRLRDSRGATNDVPLIRSLESLRAWMARLKHRSNVKAPKTELEY